MPLYEFDCAACGKNCELLVRSADWRGTACPHCGSQQLTKRFSVFASHGGGGAPSSPQPCNRPGGCGCVGPHRHG